MATIRTFKQSFNGGELSPMMAARMDNPKYGSGLAQCKNFLVHPQGPVMYRPGFVHVNSVKVDTAKVRLIPFSFSFDQTMVLEFGPHYVRFHTQGQTLMGDDGEPYEVETDYEEDALFDIHYVQSADVLTLVHPNYPPRELRRYGATDWRLVDISFTSTLTAPGAPEVSQHINSEVSNPHDYEREYAVSALTEDGKDESPVGESTKINCNPYGDGAYNTISWDAVEGAGRYRVYRKEGGLWSYIGETTDTTMIDENLSADSSITPPIYDDPFHTAKGIESVTVVEQGSGYEQRLAGIGDYDPALVFRRRESANRETVWWSEPKYKNPTVNAIGRGLAQTVGCSFDAVVKDASGNGSGAVIRINARYERESYGMAVGPGEVAYDFNECTATFLSYEVIERGSGYSDPRLMMDRTWGGIDNSGNPTTHGWDDSDGWMAELPTVDTGVELVVSDSTGWGAKLQAVVTDGKITAVKVIEPGQGYTDPVITVKAERGSGAVLKANVGKAGDFPGAVSYFEQRRWFGGTLNRPSNLWATKSGTESDMSYSLPSQDDDRIAVRVAAREANRIRHIVPLAQLLLLTAASEWRISPLNSDALTPSSMSVRPQSYVGSNNVQPLVINSQMIYAQERGGHIRELGYNYNAGGYVSADVCLLAPHLFDGYEVTDLAYSKAPWPVVWAVSSSGKLIAFTYVPEQQVGAFSTVETDGVFESCCVVAEGIEDALYCVVRREIDGVTRRFVERMQECSYENLYECIRMDCAGTYKGEPKTEVSGIDWLEGKTVAILADGSVEPEQVVKDGKVTLTYPASVVHVGLPYNGEMQTLPIAVALQDGSYGTSHQKNVREVFFRVQNSSGLKAGPSFDSLSLYPPRGTEFAGSVPEPITDEFGFLVAPMWSAGGQVCIRQDVPLPLQVVSMTTVVELV